MNYSFWEKQFLEKPTDVTIIGAGIVGLSTAISIKEKMPHWTVKVLEKAPHPNGASTKNAGFSCFGSVSELLDDIETMGESACMEVVLMRWKGLAKLRHRLGDKAIDYRHCGGTELFRKQDDDLRETCFQSISYCNQLMKEHLSIENCYREKRNTLIPAFRQEAIVNEYEGTIDPLRMMQSLFAMAVSLGVSIEYGIDIMHISLSDKVLHTSENVHISYKTLIVCTNGFSRRLLPELAVEAARNQVLITEPLPSNPLSSGYHIDKGYIYFREVEGRILLGGGRNVNPVGEATDQFGTTEEIQQYLQEVLEQIYPGASTRIAYTWSGILGVGPSKFPILERLDADVLVGVRMGGMGVAIGSYLGDVLADLALDQ